MIYHITSKEWRLPDTDKIVYVNPDKVERIKSFLLKEKEVSFDSETTGLFVHQSKLFCYQIGTRKDQFVIDHRVVPIIEFKEILETLTLLGLNLGFDLKFLYKHGIYPKQVKDAMLQECILTSGLYDRAYVKKHQPYSFKTLSLQYCGDDKIDKSIGAGFATKPYDERFFYDEVTYSALDVVHPFEIIDKQEDEIRSRNLNALADLENRFVLALAMMEFNGIKLDTVEWEEIKQDVDFLLEEVTSRLEKDLYDSNLRTKTIKVNSKPRPLFYEYETMGGRLVSKCSVLWSSPDQVKQVFAILDIDVDSVSKLVLDKMQVKYPFIKTYLEYKALDSLKSKFTDTLPKFIDPVTNRIHTQFWQIVSTGRLSASKPNLQQIPSRGTHGKKMRHCFIADEGEMLVTSDISGAELRIIAELSQDPLWLSTFREGRDLHGVIASELFGISPEESAVIDFPGKVGTPYRAIVKTVNFGLAYGMTEYKLSNTLNISIEEAKAIIDAYFKKVPLVKRYLDRSGLSVRKTGVAYTMLPIQRPRYFDMSNFDEMSKYQKNIKLGEYERAGKNSPKLYGRLKLDELLETL